MDKPKYVAIGFVFTEDVEISAVVQPSCPLMEKYANSRLAQVIQLLTQHPEIVLRIDLEDLNLHFYPSDLHEIMDRELFDELVQTIMSAAVTINAAHELIEQRDFRSEIVAFVATHPCAMVEQTVPLALLVENDAIWIPGALRDDDEPDTLTPFLTDAYRSDERWILALHGVSPRQPFADLINAAAMERLGDELVKFFLAKLPGTHQAVALA